jgi:phosphopentomutase
VRRAFVVVIDACGAGALSDSADYGDAGANTLGHLAAVTGGLHLPTLARLGLGSILSLDGVPPAADPVVHGQLRPLGVGKDSTAGHWELMGVVQTVSPPVYPGGFPREVIDVVVSAAGGRAVICNRVCNGIEAIDDYGAEQLRTGALIVYTSQDSVLQIAAHERVATADELHAICREVRAKLPPMHAVGRVIARPFTGEPGAFQRTDARHDYGLAPRHSYLDELQAVGAPVHTVGKVGQLFAGSGIDEQHPGATNAVALAETTRLMEVLDHGFVFTNLIETDQVYGHRHDAEGFHRALQEIDRVVAEWLGALGPDDLLVLTADHGCDVTMAHTEHTRECVPLLAMFPGGEGRRHDGPLADVGASVLAWVASGAASASLPGRSFVS